MSGSPVAELAQIAGSFGHLLHAAGVPVTPERSARFATSINLAEPQSLADLYWLGRVNLITAHDQVDIYDRVFAQVFRGIIDMADFRGDSSNQAPPEAAPSGERRPGDPERTGSRITAPAEPVPHRVRVMKVKMAPRKPA